MNRRPVDFRQLEKLLQRVFSQAAGLDPTALKFPVCVVSLELNDCACATAGFDPNLEPNKQRVGLACAGMLLAGLEHHLRQIYGLRVSSEADDSVVGGDDELNDSYGQLLKNCADAELAAQSCVKDDDSGGSGSEFPDEDDNYQEDNDGGGGYGSDGGGKWKRRY